MSLRTSSSSLLRSVAGKSVASRSAAVPSSRGLRIAAAAPSQQQRATPSIPRQQQPRSTASFSTSATRLNEFENPFGPNSLDHMTEEEQMLQEAVRRFAQDVVGPKVQEMDENEKMDPAIIKGLFDQGLMSIETDPDLGGAGGSFTSAIIVIEELAKVDASVSVLCDVHNTLVNTVMRKYASDTLLKKYMPLLATEQLGSFCLSEPASGSDAFAMKTSCKKSDDGKHWILNGSKMWITNSAEAEFFIVFAQGDPSKGYKGISAFAVEKSMGVEIAKKEKKLGIKASSTCTVNFDDVKVPIENLIGEEGKGYKIAIEILNEGRVGIGAQMIGIAQGAFDKSVRYAYERKQFGQPVAKFQGMQFQFAEAATDIEAARLMVYNAARLKEEGRPFAKQAAMAKIFAARVAQRVSGDAIDWAGGVGFTRETGIEKYMRDSRIGSIYEGSNNIHLQTIAKFNEAEMGLKA